VIFSNSSGIVDVLTSECVLLESIEEVILFLLEERECLPVLVEAGVDALGFIFAEAAANLEVDAEVGAELVLAGNGGIRGPVLVVLQELALEDWGGHLHSTDGLEGVDLGLVAWLSHICLLISLIFI